MVTQWCSMILRLGYYLCEGYVNVLTTSAWFRPGSGFLLPPKNIWADGLAMEWICVYGALACHPWSVPAPQNIDTGSSATPNQDKALTESEWVSKWVAMNYSVTTLKVIRKLYHCQTEQFGEKSAPINGFWEFKVLNCYEKCVKLLRGMESDYSVGFPF